MADFFTPNTTYLRNDPYKAPEQLEVFHCVAVAKSPRNGELRAFGFAKGLTAAVEAWYSTALTPEVWAVGWVEHTEVLFASTAETVDAVTEAFVDVADAERYAQRDEYVNSTGPHPEVALTVRDQAIGCITEKLRELARIENALHANHARATKELGGMSYQTYSDHREAAELNYVTADYYELLVEAITSGSLFDELDKQFPRDEPMTNRDVDPVNVDECDAYADAYSDTPIESGS